MGHMKHKMCVRVCVCVCVCVRMCVCETSQLAESVLKLKQNGWCETGNVISKLCAGQATKKRSVNSSVEPVGHTGVKKWHMAHK